MYGLHFLIQETQGFLHKFRFKADLKDAVRKKAAGEPGGNPGRSRRCIRGAFFQPEGGHCGNGKTRKCEDAQVRRPAFLFVFIGTAMDRNL